jgi:uncharacterized protein (TIGR02594 family)
MKDFSKGAVIDDETAWCGGFMGFCLRSTGFEIPANPLAARQYEKVGKTLDRPAVGAIAVWWRGSRDGWQGHVNFVVGRDKSNRLMCLGGNQNNAVTIAPYDYLSDANRLIGFRWPSIWPSEHRFNLPIIASNGEIVSEA